MGVGRSRQRNPRSTSQNNRNNNAMSDQQNGGGNENDRRLSADSEEYDDRTAGEDSFHSLLSFLIRSGQVRVINRNSTGYSIEDDETCRSDSEEEHPSSAAGTNQEISTKALKENDIFAATLASSGEFKTVGSCKSRNLTKLISLRDIGLTENSSFSVSDKCFINNQLLPNRMAKIDTYRSKVFVGQFIKDGNVFVTACQDQKIRFYDTTSTRYKLFNTIEARDVGWSVLDVAVSPDGSHVIYSSWSDYVHQCNIYGDAENHVAFNLQPREYRFCCFSLRFSRDGSEILAGASDRCLYVYDKERNCRTLRIEAHEDDVNAVCFADDTSKIIYSGGDDGLIKVWDRRTLSEDEPKPVGCLAGHSDGITYIDSKGDARYLISNSKDQCIKLWDVRCCSNREAILATKTAVADQSWDYRWQNVPRKSNRICLNLVPLLLSKELGLIGGVRRVDGDSSVMTYTGGHTVLHTLIRCFFSPSFSTGQRYIYCGCARGSCIVYDILTGKPVSNLRGHNACVRDVAWHPYNNEICTSSWDSIVGRWSYDGRDEEERDSDTSSAIDGDSSNDDSDDERRVQRRPSRLLRLYRRTQAPLRRSERIREQQRRRRGATLMF